jgi:hypothetical protein
MLSSSSMQAGMARAAPFQQRCHPVTIRVTPVTWRQRAALPGQQQQQVVQPAMQTWTRQQLRRQMRAVLS